MPFVFNSPHSGNHYTAEFCQVSSLSLTDLRRSEDVAVDLLFDSVVEIGAPLLKAHFPRAWLDVNREPYELDPRLFRERVPAHANIRSMRVAGGLGTIPRVVSENLEIYSVPPTLQEALERIEILETRVQKLAENGAKASNRQSPAPNPSETEAQKRANESGQAVLSVKGWVQPKVNPNAVKASAQPV